MTTQEFVTFRICDQMFMRSRFRRPSTSSAPGGNDAGPPFGAGNRRRPRLSRTMSMATTWSGCSPRHNQVSAPGHRERESHDNDEIEGPPRKLLEQTRTSIHGQGTCCATAWKTALVMVDIDRCWLVKPRMYSSRGRPRETLERRYETAVGLSTTAAELEGRAPPSRPPTRRHRPPMAARQGRQRQGDVSTACLTGTCRDERHRLPGALGRELEEIAHRRPSARPRTTMSHIVGMKALANSTIKEPST